MRLVGLSLNISEQSIINVVLYPNESVKHCGIVLCKASHVGQEIKGKRRASIMTSHVLMTFCDNWSGDIKSIDQVKMRNIESQLHRHHNKFLELVQMHRAPFKWFNEMEVSSK